MDCLSILARLNLVLISSAHSSHMHSPRKLNIFRLKDEQMFKELEVCVDSAYCENTCPDFTKYFFYGRSSEVLDFVGKKHEYWLHDNHAKIEEIL